jgi:hypothetical protein
MILEYPWIIHLDIILFNIMTLLLIIYSFVILIVIAWNPILQLPVDPDHVFLYGLVKDVLSLCMRLVSADSKRALRIELDRRLAAFEFPIGWSPFSFNMLRTVNARHSMELFRRAGTICVHIFQGQVFVA